MKCRLVFYCNFAKLGENIAHSFYNSLGTKYFEHNEKGEYSAFKEAVTLGIVVLHQRECYIRESSFEDAAYRQRYCHNGQQCYQLKDDKKESR